MGGSPPGDFARLFNATRSPVLRIGGVTLKAVQGNGSAWAAPPSPPATSASVAAKGSQVARAASASATGRRAAEEFAALSGGTGAGRRPLQFKEPQRQSWAQGTGAGAVASAGGATGGRCGTQELRRPFGRQRGVGGSGLRNAHARRAAVEHGFADAGRAPSSGGGSGRRPRLLNRGVVVYPVVVVFPRERVGGRRRPQRL